MHSLAFFVLSYYCDLKTWQDSVEILIFMVVWFFFEPLVFYVNKKLNIFSVDEEMLQRLEKDENVVYANPYVPRVDDFVFNIF